MFQGCYTDLHYSREYRHKDKLMETGLLRQEATWTFTQDSSTDCRVCIETALPDSCRRSWLE